MSDQLSANLAANGVPVSAEFLPQSGQRQLAAHLLAELMLRFAWLHELFHALNGHSGLLASRHDGTLNELREHEALPMVEIEANNPDPVWQLTLHCMEFDADRTALWAMMRLQEAEFEPLDALATLPKPIRLRLVLFAGFMMTFLFDKSTERRLSGPAGSHPMAYHRLHNLVRTIASNLLDPEGAAKAAFSDVLIEMMELRSRLPEMFSTAQLLADLRAPDLQATFDRVDEALEAARVQFRPYAFTAGKH